MDDALRPGSTPVLRSICFWGPVHTIFEAIA